ncbi:hypothetical protein HB364_31875, partial [Pseudoflavitalea sp. X16]|uniref:YDG domain-containing protein n=1 Tax=Paraflavitalea devenefica TaxID=2716334 RepID=UPI001ABA88B3
MIAYAYFTDANLNSVSVGAASQSVNYGTAAFVTYTVGVRATGGGSGPTNVTLTATGLPVGVTFSWSSSSPNFVAPNIINFTAAATIDVTLTVAVQNNTNVPASPSFTVTATAGATTRSGNGTLTINRKTVTGSITASDKVYDGNAAAAISLLPLTGVLFGDDVSLSGGTATFADKNIGTKTVTATGLTLSGSKAGNYILSSTTATTTATITAKPLTAAFTIADKLYDGGSTATITDRQLTGVISGEGNKVDLTGGVATFSDKHVGAGKTVTVTSPMSLTGANSGNYVIGTIAAGTASITPRGLTVTAQTDNRVYNGTTSSAVAPIVASLQTGDVIGTAPTQVYDTRNVGTNKTLTASGLVINDGNGGNNYTVTYATNTAGVISARDIHVTAQPDNRIYNGTTSSAVAPVVDPLQTGDVIGTAPTQVYDTRNVGTNKSLIASGLMISDGNSGNNYNILYSPDNTGVISVRDIHVTAQTDSRIYNGTTSSAVAPVVDPVQTGDAIGTAPTQVFDTRNVGTNKSLIASGLMINDGNSGNNYNILYSPDNTGVISAR